MTDIACTYRRHRLIIADPLLLYFFTATSISDWSPGAIRVGVHDTDLAGHIWRPQGSVLCHNWTQVTIVAR